MSKQEIQKVITVIRNESYVKGERYYPISSSARISGSKTGPRVMQVNIADRETSGFGTRIELEIRYPTKGSPTYSFPFYKNLNDDLSEIGRVLAEDHRIINLIRR